MKIQTTTAVTRFIEHEATAGLILVIAAAVAVVMTNIGFSDLYHDLLSERVRIGVGALTLDKSLHHFINDGLMAVFFFLVGLEIKREVLQGNLSTPSQLVLPSFAALGGVLVPAAIYTAINWNSPETLGGWAIPAATDIAFALGALALAGNRVPLSMKVFLLTLATMDDLAAIVIIAFFYTAQLSTLALAMAGLALLVLIALNRLNVDRVALYLIVGFLLWLFVLKSGVHATLAGVALALTIPLNRRDGEDLLHAIEEGLHPYVKFLILPLFAFANSGIDFSEFSLAQLTSPVPFGIAAGLVLGKPIGILLTCALIIGLGFARLPDQSTWRQLVGTSFLAGIGFTMSLFIGTLAFEGDALNNAVRIGVIVGSLISMTLGLAILLLRTSRSR